MDGILSGIILLAVLIVFHEFGHFIVAKACGVRVLTFSVGFGPRIFGFKHGTTDYRLSLIPLGGYVRMYGDQIEEDVPEDQKRYSFLHQPIWRKSLIAVAGPVFNFILPIFLFFFIFLGVETYYKPVVGTVLPASAAQAAGLESGDQILAIDKTKMSSFQDLISVVGSHPNESLQFSISRPGAMGAELKQVNITPTAYPDPNPLNAGEAIGKIGVMPSIQKPIVAVVDANSPLSIAGLENFDLITQFNSKAISSFPELQKHLEANLGKEVTLLVKTQAGKTKTVQAKLGPLKAMQIPKAAVNYYGIMSDEMGGEPLKKMLAKNQKILNESESRQGIVFGGGLIAKVEPETPAAFVDLRPGDRIVAVDGEKVSLGLRVSEAFAAAPGGIHTLAVSRGGTAFQTVLRLEEKPEKNAFSDVPAYVFGATLADAFAQGATGTINVGFGSALSKSFAKTGELISMTLKSLWMLVSFQVPASQIGGPIAIFGVAGQAAEQGLSFYILIMALISVNLGILNLLPIPALDGGHLLLFFIEAIQRKPLSIKTRQVATQIGVTFLLALMALALFNDISKFF